VRHGFGSAGSSRSLRTTMTRGGLSTSAAENERRAVPAARAAVLRDPSRAELLAAIADQRCCYCDDPRTFRSLGSHLAHAHGIDTHELRDRLMLPQRLPLASEAFRQRARELAVESGRVARAQSRPASGPHRRTRLREAMWERHAAAIAAMSPAERLEMVAAARAAYAAQPEDKRREDKRRASLAVSPEARARAGKAGGAVRATQMTPEVRAAMIAVREANDEYRAARAARLREMNARRAK